MNQTLYRKVRRFLRLTKDQDRIDALRQELMMRLCQCPNQEMYIGTFHLFLSEDGEVNVENIPDEEFDQLDLPFH